MFLTGGALGAVVITKVVHGWRPAGLVAYLLGPGIAEVHQAPRPNLVSGSGASIRLRAHQRAQHATSAPPVRLEPRSTVLPTNPQRLDTLSRSGN